MKKCYSKPEIMFEDFSVSCNIATCEETANSQWDACGYYVASLKGTVFISDTTGCKYTEVEPWNGSSTDASWNGVCYHVPPDYNLFGS